MYCVVYALCIVSLLLLLILLFLLLLPLHLSISLFLSLSNFIEKFNIRCLCNVYNILHFLSCSVFIFPPRLESIEAQSCMKFTCYNILIAFACTAICFVIVPYIIPKQKNRKKNANGAHRNYLCAAHFLNNIYFFFRFHRIEQLQLKQFSFVSHFAKW